MISTGTAEVVYDDGRKSSPDFQTVSYTYYTGKSGELLRPSSYTTSAVPVLITVPVTGTVTCYAHVADDRSPTNSSR